MKRSPIEYPDSNRSVITLKSLVPPVNELIDLEDVLQPELKSLSEYKAQLAHSGWTDTRIRREKRPKERGLVLIYPVDPEFENHAAIRGLEKESPIYALCLVFPGSKNDLGFRNYIENVSI